MDFYAPLSRTVLLLRRYFEDFFERYFLPADVFGAEKDFPTSESKMDFFLKESAKIPNIHLLENCMEDGIAGCMGMSDFKYVHAPGTSEILNQMLWSTRCSTVAIGTTCVIIQNVCGNITMSCCVNFL